MGQSNYFQRNRWRRRRNAVLEFAKRGFDPRYLWYRLRFNTVARFNRIGDFPPHLDIELADACNLRCVMCVQGIEDGVKGAGLMDTEFALRLIDQGAEHGLRSIKLNWRGESALHRDLGMIIAHAKKRGVLDVQLNTNGIPFTQDRIREVVNAGLDRVIISIDGATKETYERIRVRAKYETLVRNVQDFARIRNEMGCTRPFIRIQMVRMRDNAHEVEDFIRMWTPWVDDIRISDVSNRGQGDLSVGDQVPIARAQCPQPWQRMIVARDGTVVPCCSDWHMKWVIGDATKESLTDIWKGRKMTALRTLHLKQQLDSVEPCKSCFVKESYVWKRVTPENIDELSKGKIYQY
jgi:radical SAM protein with 4Fe4S-binding SPASM domain